MKQPRAPATGKEKKQHYDEIKRENALFQDYYQRQAIVSTEEWTLLMQTLALSLPTTFRITGHRKEEASSTLNQLDSFLPILGDRIRPLPWYEPAGMAWHLDIDRKTLRTDNGPGSAFHRWLVTATENGDISRQEAVSMVPPLFLNVKSHHRVLDLCAAPGSKTAQLVEAMHFDAVNSSDRCFIQQLADANDDTNFMKRDQLKDSFVTGMVIANDADQQRAYMLHHQVKRILSPALVVTNNDGVSFPHLVERCFCIEREGGRDGERGGERERDGEKEKRGIECKQLDGRFNQHFQFDRILADVPCSGDGTLRKNALLWKQWTPNLALGLHPLQVRLLERAVILLKEGGRLVYSTCSLNPIENEAVVAWVISKSGGTLNLVNVGEMLPQLKRRPGHSTWKVINKEGLEYASHDSVPVEQSRRFPPSVFPRPEYATLGLEQCLRIYPHLQNTGGFFVAVLEKVAGAVNEDKCTKSEKTVEKIEKTVNDQEEEEEEEGRKRKIPRPSRYIKVNEDEFRRLDVATDSTLNSIFTWYGIDRERVLKEGWGFYVRSDRQPIKCITMVSPAADRLLFATVMEAHQQGESSDQSKVCLFNRNLKIINAGVRIFEIYESNRPLLGVKCPYRLLYEAVDTIRPWLKERRISVDSTVISQLLKTLDSVRIEQVEQILGPGGALLECQSTTNDKDKVVTVAIPVWISERGVKAFVAQVNRPALLLQLGETLELDKVANANPSV